MPDPTLPVTRVSVDSERTKVLSSGGTGPRLEDSRFLPGAMLGKRYRIVGLLGRGGMGEVYRAADLKLGQPVALKLLPESLERDEGRLSRFMNEARVAIQVTHPNVCRVHDIGEVDTHHYLSMEYVDGEDLGSLLRRIGRLPEDKAIELARQICAGLAAAHNEGVLHRDLKPANVMIDGRGRARITDFGLAGAAEEIAGAEIRAGTPDYMAPEQLEGREVSTKSDIYALGLVLHELFTGKRVFEAETIADLTKQQKSYDSSRGSTTSLADLDPAVERVIARCLDPDPARRPETALAVAAALPGGDPIAAALAAGETPSPEMVAAAGNADALPVPAALGLGLLAVAMFVGAAWILGLNSLRAWVPLNKPPMVMVDRAQEIVARLGYTDPVYANPRDYAFGYSLWGQAVRAIADSDSEDRWERLRDPETRPYNFWYRQSPITMTPDNNDWGTFAGGRVGRWNPFPSITGQILVSMGPQGDMDFFVATPRRYRENDLDDDTPDWSVAFELAGLDMADFRPVEPRYQRFMAPDHRAAWVGPIPGASGGAGRIEAGWQDGRVVLFGILPAWDIANLTVPLENRRTSSSNFVIFFLVLTSLFVAGVAIARLNLRAGRADRRGATRLGTVVFFGTFAWEALRAHALFSTEGMIQVYAITATALFYVAVMVSLYLALEPYARRIWPSLLVSWSRLFSTTGSIWHDPLIGRSVLWGLIGGAGLSLLSPLRRMVRSFFEGAAVQPHIGDWSILLGERHVLAELSGDVVRGIAQALLFTFALVFSRVVLRKDWLALLAAAIVWILLDGVIVDTLGEFARVIVFGGLTAAIMLTLLLRHGVLALFVTMFTAEWVRLARIHDWSGWFARPAILTILCVAALAYFGYRAASSGRPASLPLPSETERG
jgi:serine/threonine-protein kinase